MNKLNAKIVRIESNAHMSLVDLAVGDDIFSATLLETPTQVNYLQLDKKVSVLFKETEVSLAKNLTGLISLRNRLKVKVKAIERGAILSAITLNYQHQELVSVITTRAMDQLALAIGDEIEALIKANEVMLSDDL
jgi:molybdate transport system regulatory protein